MRKYTKIFNCGCKKEKIFLGRWVDDGGCRMQDGGMQDDG